LISPCRCCQPPKNIGKRRHWVYFCIGPRGKYLNRLFDTLWPKSEWRDSCFIVSGDRVPPLGLRLLVQYGHAAGPGSRRGRLRLARYSVRRSICGVSRARRAARFHPLGSLRRSASDYALLQSAGIDRNSALCWRSSRIIEISRKRKNGSSGRGRRFWTALPAPERGHQDVIGYQSILYM
jgi:hypothetical protein